VFEAAAPCRAKVHATQGVKRKAEALDRNSFVLLVPSTPTIRMV
jgi:hypothetical protein